MNEDLLRLKREKFRIEIKKKKDEQMFQTRRTVLMHNKLSMKQRVI
jgi:hypothetical protein